MEDTRGEAARVRAVGAGDSGALTSIYHAHKNEILSVSFHLLGDRSAAEDVLQDVFVRFARCARTLALTGSLRAYLMRAAVNRARDVLARKAPSARIDPGLEDPRPGPVAIAFANDDAQRVTDALAVVPAAQREVVLLHVHGALTFREVAEILDTSINTVQSRYRYGLEAMRQHLRRRETRDDELRSAT